MMCPDGNSCDTWFGADGCLICRHGLVASAGDSTAVDFKCPLKILEGTEKIKWNRFMEDLPHIMEKFRLTHKGRET